MVDMKRLWLAGIVVAAALMVGCGSFAVSGQVAPAPTPTVVSASDEFPGSGQMEPEPADGATESSAEAAAVALMDALNARDEARMQAMMGETFIIGYWFSEGQIVGPAEAAAEIRQNLLPPEGALTYTLDPQAFPDLGGFDLPAVWGLDSPVVMTIFTQGWGPDGRGEAFLGLADHADGTPYWYGVVYAANGFAGALSDGEPLLYPTPGPGVTDWPSVVNEAAVAGVEWRSYTAELVHPQTGEVRRYTFSFPVSWQVMDQYSAPSYLIIQNEVDPPIDHGIVQVPFAKLDLALLTQPPVFESQQPAPEAFRTVTAAGQPAVLYIEPLPDSTDVISRNVSLVFQDRGAWISVSGWVVIPDGDIGAMEFYINALLTAFASLTAG